MRIPNINCIYYDQFGQCHHEEMKRGFLIWKFRSTCKTIKHPRRFCSLRKNPKKPYSYITPSPQKKH